MSLLSALDPQASAVVEACAGAGKTWLLVSRIVRLLLTGVPPASILAVTFTRKAGEEMKTRLDQWLLDLRHQDDPGVRRFLVERGVPEPQATRLVGPARMLHATVATALPHLGVQTFDSWFLNLTRQAPIDAAIVRGDITAQPARFEEDAWQRVFRAARADPQGDLAQALDQLLIEHGWTALRNLARLAARNSIAWFAHARDPAERLRRLNASFGPAWRESLQPLQPAVLDLLAWAIQVLARGKNQTQRTGAEALQGALALGDEARVAALTQALFTKDETPRVHLRSWLAAHDGARCEALFAAFSGWLQARRFEAVIDLHARLYPVIDAYMSALSVSLAAADAITFDQLSSNALQLTGDPATREVLIYKLDSRYRHLLIDELQDVNPTQWRVLENWLRESAGGDMTVFAVGDPKQSIYGFRGSDPAVFAHATAFLQRAFGARHLYADTTRRLAPALTELVNATFADGALTRFRPHHTTSCAPGGVSVLPLQRAATPVAAGGTRDPLTEPRADQPDPLSLEAEQIALEIATRLGRLPVADAAGERPLQPGDILLLLRTRAAMATFEEALKRRGIPYTSSRRGGLVETLEVGDVRALIRFLIQPEDDLSLARVLVSPLFGVPDTELTPLALAARQSGLSWWAAWDQWETPTGALHDARLLLQRWRQAADRVPPHDLLDDILLTCEAPQRYAAAAPAHLRAQVVANLEAVLDLALAIDQGRGMSIARFAHELDLIATLPDEEAASEGAIVGGEDTVRVMTIHGAKGLEAPWVILANCEVEARDDSQLLLIDWPLDAAAPTHLSFAPSRHGLDTRRRALADALKAQRAAEDMQLLYVALSRARQYLLASGTARERDGSGWHARLLRASVGQPPLPVYADNPAPGDPAPGGLPQDESAPRPLRETPATIGIRRAQRSSAERFGEAFHSALEACADQDMQTRDRRLASLPDEVRDAVLAVLRSPTAARFFAAAPQGVVLNERDWVAADGAVLRPDRVVQLTDAVWVLDYKSGIRGGAVPAAVIDQLARYRAVVRESLALPEGTAVRSAVITAAGEVIET